MHAVYEELVMQVGPGCSPCCANGSNDLPLSNTPTCTHSAFVKVKIASDVAVPMANKYVITVGFGIA